MRSNLPLEVLGWMGPVLSWVEGAEGLRFPQTWLADSISLKTREQAWLVRELPTYSYDNVDEIVQLARKRSEGTGERRKPPIWPPERRATLSPPWGYDLSDALLRLGERYFCWNGSELSVREGQMEELHELALRFPVAHLIRRMHAQAVATGYLSADSALKLPERLSLLHTSSHGLYTVVHRGVSEGHVHLWGVTGGGEIWADHLLQPLAPGTLEKFQPEDRRLFVLSRAGVRLLALGVLCALCGFGPSRNGRQGSEGPQKNGERKGPGSPHLPFPLISLLDLGYFARNVGEDWEVRRRLREEFREATKTATSQGGVARPELDWIVRLIDPTARRMLWTLVQGQNGGGERPEWEGIRMRIQLLERLHFEVQRLLLELPVEPSPQDPLSDQGALLRQFLHEAFFRYLVLQTHHWQLATQSGKTTGLRQFRRFYSAQQRRALSAAGAEEQGMILQRFREEECLHAVEGRVSPPRSPGELIPWILGYAEAVDNKQLESFGLLIHFIKAEPGQTDARVARAGNRTVRYGRIRRQTRETAFRLFRLLSTPHPVVPFIVGIDAANLELPTPPEVFAPAFRFLREFPIAAQGASRRLDRFETHSEIASLMENRRLRMTYHVGEEFRHLLSGLRAIAEAIEFLDARPGDRLGHAIALAVEPKVWAEQTGYQAVLSRQEWLDTLVWVHHFLGPGHDVLGELAVEDKIQQLSRAVYGAAGDKRDWPLPSLYDSWLLRQLDPYSFDLDLLTKEGKYQARDRTRRGAHHRRWAQIQDEAIKKINAKVGSNAAYELLKLYWFSSTVRRDGDQIESIDMQPRKHAWLKLCGDIQEKMKRLVQRRELVVEVNPSSNRLIGPLSELSDHHIFRMTLNEERRLSRDIRVTINTDDPGVFNTSLSHEYYLLGEIVMRQGVPEAEVIEWLDWLRTNGNDSSFVRTLPPRGDPRLQKILASLQRNSYRIQDRMGGADRHESFWKRFWEKREETRREEARRLERKIGETRREEAQRLEERIGDARREEVERLEERIDQLMRELKALKAERNRP